MTGERTWKSEVGSQKSEAAGQKSEAGNQKAEVSSPKHEELRGFNFELDFLTLNLKP